MATRVTIIKKGGSSLKQEVTEFILPITDKHLTIMGELTTQAMKGHIRESLVRPGSTGNLENSIFAERISPLELGVGNIDYLNKNAPYWHWINFGIAQSGRRIPPKSRGEFSPGDPQPNNNSAGKGRWNQSEGGKYLIIPKRPIKAHNYIERTVTNLSTIAERAIQL